MVWIKDFIVNVFIVEFGFFINGMFFILVVNLLVGWYLVSQSLGCGGVDQGEDIFECMQFQIWQNILVVFIKCGVMFDFGLGGFGLIVDGKVVFEDVSVRRK